MLKKFFVFILVVSSTSILPISPSTAGDASIAQNLSTATACQVSLKAQWQPFEAPYPCFVEGTELSINAPAKSKLNSALLISINSEVQATTWGTTVAISKPILGLNSVSFGIANEKGLFTQVTQESKFIIYAAPKSLTRMAATTEGKPYVVVIRAGVDVNQVVVKLGLAPENYLLSSISGGNGPSPTDKLIYVMDLTPAQLTLAQGISEIESVTPQQLMSIDAIQTSPPSWGLDRIDESALPLDNRYEYKRTGAGVDVYVMDSGINRSHTELTGRVDAGAYLPALGSTEDCMGHGTHVSGTIAGSTYGVAKQATIIPLRIFGCSGGVSLSDEYAAFQWIINDHVSTSPAVVNLSLGGGYNSTTNSWIQAMINDGLVVVVAAGNDGLNACNYSPASAPNAITVGATTNLDQDAWYSNIGSCVDIFAPGSSITSSWIGSSTAVNTIEGTSMATPHVAGAAALILEANFSSYLNPLQANAYVRTSLVSEASSNVLFAYGQSPGIWYSSTVNLLLNISSIIGSALTPTFSTSASTSDGFTLQISNYDADFTWAVSNSETGTATISGTGLVTVSGLAPGVSSTVTISTSRTGYESGSATSSSISSNLGSALTPTFATATQTSDGFTLQISNYDAAFAWAGTHSSTGTVTISGTGLITVTGLAPGVASTVTISTSRTGYGSGSATSGSISSITGAALTPTFATATRTANGFTLQISNYDAAFTWAGTSSASGSVAISGSGLISVTGLAAGVSSTVTITTTRTGYTSGTATSSSTSSLLAALTPAFSTATRTADGFTLQISNYSASYTWAGTHSSTGTVTISGTGLITVTGLATGVASTVTITTTRSGYVSGSATSSSTSSLLAPLTPIFSTSVPTDDGFTLQISNYNASYTWAGTNSATGTVAISGLGLITVTGLAHEVASTVTITTTRTGYISGSATSSSVSSNTGPALTPTFAPATPTASGFTLQISNYNASYTWAGTNSASGTVAISGTGLVTVSGVAPGVASTVTITTTRTGYTSGSATSPSVTSLLSALTPIFIDPVSTADGFTLQISNYDAAYSWTGTNSSSGTVAISDTGMVTVSGLSPGLSSTVTVSTSRTGYCSGSATSSAISSITGAALTPTFATATPTANGFTLQINNYNASYTWAGTNSSTGTVAINGSGLITVTGIAAGVSSTVTITTSRTGYLGGLATSSSITSLLSALTPTFATGTSTSNGFTLQISNYDAAYAWSGTNSSTGTVSISGSGLITVTGLGAGVSSTVTIQTTRSGYVAGTATSISISSIAPVYTPPPYSPPPPDQAALTPTFTNPTSTATGFTLQISNYDSAFSWVGTNSSTGIVIISGTGLITVTGLAPSVASSVTIKTERAGFTSGSATSNPISSLPGVALTPAFSVGVATLDGFTLQLTNYNVAYSWFGISSQNGSVQISASGLITVSGLAPGTISSVTVSTSRTGYVSGSATSDSVASITGTALTPAFSAATPTTDGFTVQISNYDGAFNWTATNSQSGIVTISGTGLITVAGLAPGVESTVTLTSSRVGYSSASVTSSGFSSITGSALVPSFAIGSSTSNGFMIQIANFDPAFTWQVTNSSTGTAVISGTGLITVTGLAPGTASKVVVTTSRIGYAIGGATSVSISAKAAAKTVSKSASTSDPSAPINSIKIGKRINGSTSISLNFIAKYAGRVVTVELGTLKNGKLSYTPLGSVKLNTSGDATLSTKTILPKGSTVRVKLGQIVIQSVVVG